MKRSKLYFGDTGLACTLLAASAESLYAPQLDRALFGQLLETFVLQELRRQASAHRDSIGFSHYREKSGVAVDIVVSHGRQLAGIDVKASATVVPKDLRELERLRDLAGEHFSCGVVLYDGHYCLPLGDRLYAVPIRFLWESV